MAESMWFADAHIPKAIKAAMVDISPIANGRFDRTANTFLNALCKKTHEEPSAAGFPFAFPALPPLSSDNGGGAEPKRMIFLLLFLLFFLVLLSGSASASKLSREARGLNPTTLWAVGRLPSRIRALEMEQREEKDALRTCWESREKVLLGFRRREDIGGCRSSREREMCWIRLKVGFLLVEQRSHGHWIR
ncbi:hypothetical protein B296_00019240 [Ensete ventricosum]|uniref:Uncharacterized protein n=1 Tax=Ensete ventricosum TaxID=4639 RepID=A0A426YJ03_ENSVE|nr:hypothetical protein B296_00019240 [Ensete ventricosum]